MKKFAAFFVIFFLFEATFGQSKISIDVSAEHQTIAGFGAFGGVKAYWEPPPFYTDEFLDYFIEDMGTSIVRTNIFWDLEPANDNPFPYQADLAKFNYKAGADLAKQLPYYKALKDAGIKKIVATAWTPPAWMKLLDEDERIPDQCYNCNNCPKGDPARKICGGRLNPAFYHEYAEYLVTYVKILKAEIGLDLYAINIQNEPYFANPFEANVMYPDEYADALRIVGERFRQDGLSTKIFGPEHMAEWSWGVQKNYVTEILEDESVKPYIDIYAVHGYVDGVAPDFGSAEGWTALHENITVAHGKPLWMTETSGYPQTLDGAMNLATSMYLALRFGNISAWVYWSISAEPGSEFALMADGAPTILYYASKQFFKFIKPDAIRVEANAEDANVLPLAFKNPSDGAMTILLINKSGSAVEVEPEISVGPNEYSLYRTSETENSTSVGSYTSGTLSLPAKSITTLVGYGPAAPTMDEIPDYYLTVGENVELEILLTGIEVGADGPLEMTIENSNTSIVPSVGLEYTSPLSTGVLTFSPNTSAPGRTTITIKLTNQTATDAATFSFNTTEREFTVEVVDPVTGVEKKSENESLSVYPNPGRSQLIVDVIDDTSLRNLCIRDVAGHVVWERNLSPSAQVITIDTSRWPKGLYVVLLNNKKDRESYKVVVE